MSTTTLDDLLTELKAIRAALEARPAAAQPPPRASTAPSSPTSPGKFDDEPIPQPAQAWHLADAKRHQVHFGKNTGVELGSLSERSISFYAKEKPPHLKNDGTPYAIRPSDIDLDNASRTIWHTLRGTLGTPAPAAPFVVRRENPAPAPAPSTPRTKAVTPDEDVPF